MPSDGALVPFYRLHTSRLGLRCNYKPKLRVVSAPNQLPIDLPVPCGLGVGVTLTSSNALKRFWHHSPMASQSATGTLIGVACATYSCGRR